MNFMKNKVLVPIAMLSLAIASSFILSNKEYENVTAAARETIMDHVTPTAGAILDTENGFFDDFDTGISTARWNVTKRRWGANNGGQRPENLFKNSNEGTITFRALGNYYTDSEFVNTNEGAPSTDGKLTGATIETISEYGPGRFETRMRIAPSVGACSAFWIYSAKGSDYTEIDIEFPYKDSDGFRFDKMLCSSYISESTVTTSPTSQLINSPVDNEYHTFAFDWQCSEGVKRVDWYFDGQLVKTNTTNIPSKGARIWIGCWVQNNENGFGTPNFDKTYMDVDYVRYIPFKNQTVSNVGENPYIPSQTVPTTNTVINRKNFLPNAKFDSGSTLGYEKTGTVTLSKDYDNSLISSYGAHINNGSLSYPFLVDRFSTMNLSLDYKGSGYYKVDFYNRNNTLVQSVNLLSGKENTSGVYETVQNNITIMSNYYKAVVTVGSNSSLYIDNLFFGYIDGGEVTPSHDSYGFTSYKNVTSTAGYGRHVITPNGEASRSWTIPFGNLYMKEEVGTYLLSPGTEIMDDAQYSAIKACITANSLVNTDKSCALIQNFDMSEFVDFEIAFYDMSFNSSHKVSIIYSVDSGATYKVLLTTTEGNAATGSGHFKYILKANSSNLAVEDQSFTKIRFAFIGSENSDAGYKVSAVIINNHYDFKNKLDNWSLCSAHDGTKELLNHEYSNLSASELTDVTNSEMKYYNQTYLQGYNYLVEYWNGGLGGLRLFTPTRYNYVYYIIAISAFIIVVGALIITKCGRRKAK